MKAMFESLGSLLITMELLLRLIELKFSTRTDLVILRRSHHVMDNYRRSYYRVIVISQ